MVQGCKQAPCTGMPTIVPHILGDIGKPSTPSALFRSLLVPGLLELAHPALKAGFHPVVFNYMSKTASKRDMTPSVAPRTLTAS